MGTQEGRHVPTATHGGSKSLSPHILHHALCRLPASTPLYALLKLFQTGRSHMVLLTQPEVEHEDEHDKATAAPAEAAASGGPARTAKAYNAQASAVAATGPVHVGMRRGEKRSKARQGGQQEGGGAGDPSVATEGDSMQGQQEGGPSPINPKGASPPHSPEQRHNGNGTEAAAAPGMSTAGRSSGPGSPRLSLHYPHDVEGGATPAPESHKKVQRPHLDCFLHVLLSLHLP